MTCVFCFSPEWKSHGSPPQPPPPSWPGRCHIEEERLRDAEAGETGPHPPQTLSTRVTELHEALLSGPEQTRNEGFFSKPLLSSAAATLALTSACKNAAVSWIYFAALGGEGLFVRVGVKTGFIAAVASGQDKRIWGRPAPTPPMGEGMFAGVRKREGAPREAWSQEPVSAKPRLIISAPRYQVKEGDLCSSGTTAQSPSGQEDSGRRTGTVPSESSTLLVLLALKKEIKMAFIWTGSRGKGWHPSGKDLLWDRRSVAVEAPPSTRKKDSACPAVSACKRHRSKVS